MRKRDLMTIGVCAIGGFAAALMLAAPSRLDATGPQNPLPLEIAKPSMVINGVEVSLHHTEAKRSIRPGDALPMTLVAKNTTDRTVEVPVTVSLRTSSMASAVSRVLILPTESWRQEKVVIVNAGETKTITIEPDVRLAPATSVSVVLSAADQRIAPISVVVPGTSAPAAQTAER